MNSVYLDGFNLVVDDQEGTAYLTFSFVNMSLFFVLKSKGVVEERKWIEEKEEWMVPFWNPNTECDVYGMCGAFGSCDPLKKPICSCLRGFEPKNVEEWNGGNWSDDKRDLKVVIIVPVILGVIVFVITVCAFFSWRWMDKRKAMKEKNRVMQLDEGEAWELWNENNIVGLIDPVIYDPCFQVKMIRSIRVGLLCVQEFVKDRPTMSTVISMLNAEIVELPAPKQPAFIERRNVFDTESAEQSQNRISINNVTLTHIDVR
ncbi:hypothetical protein Patl1_10945 [Pistacia atlantica]|uniref:Uncharacterized protein n=1 Tax=Pistacia atlantica TaxID=434234 RepID=A0ACC1A7K4_9ROSI|nr:hypothetical protein Patl1_10945 [Pistacia atlantica]